MSHDTEYPDKPTLGKYLAAGGRGLAQLGGPLAVLPKLLGTLALKTRGLDAKSRESFQKLTVITPKTVAKALATGALAGIGGRALYDMAGLLDGSTVKKAAASQDVDQALADLTALRDRQERQKSRAGTIAGAMGLTAGLALSLRKLRTPAGLQARSQIDTALQMMSHEKIKRKLPEVIKDVYRQLTKAGESVEQARSKTIADLREKAKKPTFGSGDAIRVTGSAYTGALAGGLLTGLGVAGTSYVKTQLRERAFIQAFKDELVRSAREAAVERKGPIPAAATPFRTVPQKLLGWARKAL